VNVPLEISLLRTLPKGFAAVMTLTITAATGNEQARARGGNEVGALWGRSDPLTSRRTRIRCYKHCLGGEYDE
jgi:hypothetical protein